MKGEGRRAAEGSSLAGWLAVVALATDEIKLRSFPPPTEARKMKGSFFARENPTSKSEG